MVFSSGKKHHYEIRKPVQKKGVDIILMHVNIEVQRAKKHSSKPRLQPAHMEKNMSCNVFLFLETVSSILPSVYREQADPREDNIA